MAIQIPYSDGLNERQRQRVEGFNPRSGTLHSIKEAAALLDVTTRTVQRWIEAGTLAAFKIGGRWRIPANEIGRLLHMEGRDDEN